MSPMHQWARFYASLGWKIFPLVPGTKSPFAESHGSSEATSDPTQIDAWWTAHPEANIGTRPSAAGLYVFDVDPRNGGAESFAQLQAEHGPLSSQLAVTSPGGGFHLYLAARPGARYKGEPAPGIDGKYNGYAVLPPSLHPNGGRYEWAFGAPDAGKFPAPAPAWLERPERSRPDGAALQRAGSLGDVELIRQALALREPDSYASWSMAIASLRHWEDTTDGAEGIGYELAREWSAQSPKHDDGVFDDKWQAWDSDRSGARTLGSLLHESGLTREQMMPSAAEVFGTVPAVVPEPPRPLQWTTDPVEGFKGPTDPDEVLAELMTTDARGFSEKWRTGDAGAVLDDVAWRAGGCCETVLRVLLRCPGTQDTEHLRAMIAHNCANRTTWYTIGALTPEQKATAESGLMTRLEVDDGKAVNAQRVILSALPAFPSVFKRSGQLVRVVPDGRILPYTLQTLSQEIETYLRLEKGGRGNAAKCPEFIAKRVLEDGSWPGVSEVVAAIPMPCVRADGTVIAAKGLDEQTGLFLLNEWDRPPQVLDLEGCKAAFAKAWEPFAEFPFHDSTARGVMAAVMLTAVCRPALEAAPAFLINAQSPGTGKTLLCDALVTLAGSTAGGRALSSKAEEQAKQLTSIFKEAPAAFYFDNFFGTLRGGTEFCMALTSPVFKSRLLGGNEELQVPNRALTLVNGNNVGLRGDVVRRFLTLTLDSGDGLSTRVHGFNPVHLIRRNLAAYRGALIDLLVTYKAGVGDWRPADGLPSFEDWNKLVRGCVIWLGQFIDQVQLSDPLDALRAAQEDDPDLMLHDLMLDAWEQRFGDAEVRARDAQNLPVDPSSAPLWLEAYETVCVDSNGRQNPQRFLYWLREHRGKIRNGRYLEGKKDRKKIVVWKLVKI